MKGEEIVKEITVSPKEDIGEVIRAAGPHTRIMLSEGVYRQKLEISVPYIELVGAGTDKTVIVYGDYANKIHEDGKEYNTFRTYTAAVLAPHVSFIDLTVENDSLRPYNKIRRLPQGRAPRRGLFASDLQELLYRGHRGLYIRLRRRAV